VVAAREHLIEISTSRAGADPRRAAGLRSTSSSSTPRLTRPAVRKQRGGPQEQGDGPAPVRFGGRRPHAGGAASAARPPWTLSSASVSDLCFRRDAASPLARAREHAHAPIPAGARPVPPEARIKAPGQRIRASVGSTAARYRGDGARASTQDNLDRPRGLQSVCRSRSSPADGRGPRRAQGPPARQPVKLTDPQGPAGPGAARYQRMGREAILREASADTLSRGTPTCDRHAGLVPVGDPTLTETWGHPCYPGRGARSFPRIEIGGDAQGRVGELQGLEVGGRAEPQPRYAEQRGRAGGGKRFATASRVTADRELPASRAIST